MNTRTCARICAVLVVLGACSFALPGRAEVAAVLRCDGPDSKPCGWQSVQKLLDLSGLAWLSGNTFLAVHDAKYPEEANRVRVSLLRLPDSLDGIQWRPLHVRFPQRPSSDLESAARIPGTRKVLLLESGDDASALDRIYLARVGSQSVRVVDATEWSSFTSVFNVEGAAVAATDDGYIFIWAERADGETSTLVQWTDLTLAPFAIGASGVVKAVPFSLPADLAARYNRPLVGLDVDDSGQIFAVAAFDPDADSGPFRSAIMAIGRVVGSDVVLEPAPNLLGVMDGFKAESVAIRAAGENRALFTGTDDENFGGTLRQLQLGP